MTDQLDLTHGTNIVAVALDDKMVYGLCVLSHSLVRTSSEPLFLLVGYFEGRLSQSNREIIESYLQWLGVPHAIQVLQPDELFTERRHLTITTFSKFVLSDIYPGAHLWLDLDTVARPGWDKVFSSITAASPTTAIVVADKITGVHTRFEGFNAGVLGWTSSPRKQWRSALAALPEKRFSSEQYLFNTLYADSVSHVDVGFNFLSSWHDNFKDTAHVRIIHYSGPVKPWHLARRHRDAWKVMNSTWEEWFLAEDQLLADKMPQPLASAITTAKRRALVSGRLHTGKGALAGWFMRALAVLGPLGDPLVALLQRRRSS